MGFGAIEDGDEGDGIWKATKPMGGEASYPIKPVRGSFNFDGN